MAAGEDEILKEGNITFSVLDLIAKEDDSAFELALLVTFGQLAALLD